MTQTTKIAYLVGLSLLVGGALTPASADQYSLTVVNNSTSPGRIAVFQTDPDIGVPNVHSLAWFSEYTYPGTTATFKWTLDYNFVWGETGNLSPGVVFENSQTAKAGLKANNKISLYYDTKNAAYHFEDPESDSHRGSLIIDQGPNIPIKQAAVGIGMSGRGTFIVQAQPNMTFTFTPHLTYSVVFGDYLPGEVVDVTEVTNQAAKINFLNGQSMMAVLNQDNTWTIKPVK